MILCCGEALIDMLPRRLEGGENAFLPAAGGAIFNSAIALGRLGADASLLTGLNRDLFGQLLARVLAESGVDHSHAIVSDRPMTLAFVTLVDGNAQYAFYDENTAGRMITVEDLPQPAGVEAALFGGISLISEPCGTAYETFARRLAPGSVIALDPNIRPGFIRDEDAYRARIARMIAIADIVKLSDEDLDWLAPGADFEREAERWLAAGTSIVLRTRGAEGATAFTGNGIVTVPAVPARVVDTVGAGDTFNAGILAGLAQASLLGKDKVRGIAREPLEAAMTLAVRAAAVTVSRAGANPPTLAELDAMPA